MAYDKAYVQSKSWYLVATSLVPHARGYETAEYDVSDGIVC